MRALMLNERDAQVDAVVVDDAALPEGGDVTIDVEWSTVNYKDGLVVRNRARLVREYPHVPGVDLAGWVAASDDARWSPGDEVIATGWRMGETSWGGFAEQARVKGDWLVPVPAGMTTRTAMAFGTAGLTSALAVMALEDHGLRPDRGEVLVTGAGGGVGGVAVHLLARAGFPVAASTGRRSTHDRLRSLGASTFVDRDELSGGAAKPLLSERWQGCVDAVGGPTLAAVLAQLSSGGSVAACGNTGGVEFAGNVIPFLLRGVNVLGIDSVMAPTDRRLTAWQRLAVIDPDILGTTVHEIGLAEVPAACDDILAGQIDGRVIVDLTR